MPHRTPAERMRAAWFMNESDRAVEFGHIVDILRFSGQVKTYAGMRAWFNANRPEGQPELSEAVFEAIMQLADELC